jgi:hypothetical protein
MPHLRRIRHDRKIIGKLADVLEIDPVEFFWRPVRGSRKRAD